MTLAEALAHPASVGAIAGAIGAIAGAIGARWRSAPSTITATSVAVAGILKHYTDALHEQVLEAKALRAEVALLHETVNEQSREIADLTNQVFDLNALLKEHNIPPPPPRTRKK